MQVKVQAWGNSLGLRIPKAYAQELQVGPGSTLELSMEAGVLVAKPSAAVELDALLARVNPDNTHHELNWGQVSGDELW
jgi:antitoxin MazE